MELSDKQETIVNKSLDMYLDSLYDVLPTDEYRALEHEVEELRTKILPLSP